MFADEHEHIRATIREFFAEAAPADDQDLFDSGTLDSLDLVELIFFIEERLQVDIFTEDISRETFSTVIQIADHVYRKMRTCDTND